MNIYNFIALSTIGMISGWSYAILDLSYFPASCHDITLDTCDNMSKLLYDFKSSMGSLAKEAHTNNNSKQLLNYWLYGTASEINWFDKGCLIAWDYIKDTCNITPTDNNSYEGLTEELVITANYKPNYLISGLGCLSAVCVIFGNLYYNLDILKAVYTYLDIHLYNFLCMFDFPGFMVNSWSVMPLGPDFEFTVEHTWRFLTDPADGVLRLVHLATYTLDHDYFWFQFNSFSPTWSISSYLTLTFVPGLDWPFNYDHFHFIHLFDFIMW